MAAGTERRRLRVEVRGAVQGVGFRPFVFRLAEELGLSGWVRNDGRGVFLEAEGPAEALERLLERLEGAPPPRAVIQEVTPAWLEPAGFTGFRIRHSSAGEAAPTAAVLPDVATCDECLAEVLDPGERRHLYPFTNCTNCGPRFTIVTALPYDRPHTTMAGFPLCDDCRREYEDPRDRRFHAQPVACPRCGPRLELWDGGGAVLAREGEALDGAAAALRGGRILALKALGGFHLMVDAGDSAAVARLRRRKGRGAKPLALMVADLEAARQLARVGPEEAALLASAEAPIALLERRAGAAVAEEVAPGNPDLGVMLPSTPLHHLLLRAVARPLVATSGNLSEEPICIDEREALDRLGCIADLFLVHDRPIARHADDSVARVLLGEPRLLRRARGYAPLPLLLERAPPAVLAVGAHLKNAIALSVGGGSRQVFVSQHLGDMETPRARAAFQRVLADFLRLYRAAPAVLARDLHPDYPTTRWATAAAAGELAVGEGEEGLTALAGLPVLAVQHHHAHLVACLAEHGAEGAALGVIWDGTGYGEDATVWGGEFLRGDAAGFTRAARLRPFRLPGGEAAVRQPRRCALALLWELEGEAALARRDLPCLGAFAAGEAALVARMLARGFHAPWTTSAGRLFDAVASLLGLAQVSFYEGEAAMALEFAADAEEGGAYPLPLTPAAEAGGPAELDWRPLLAALLEDRHRGASPAACSARFHNALIAAIVAVAEAVGEERVALSGGCFQNRRLAEGAARRLRGAGFRPLLHRRVPPGDGGISLGQVAVAAARLREGSS